MDVLINIQFDQDTALDDPQLSIPFLIESNGKEAGPMTTGPILKPIDTLQHIDVVKPQCYQPADANQVLDDNNIDALPPYSPFKRGAAQATLIARKPSVPFLSSGSFGSVGLASSGHIRHKITKKQASYTARKKQKSTKQAATDATDDKEDSTRNKYLERNKVAASKCRQKKKVWVDDLKAQKSELEQENSNLQHENKSLVNDVIQLKSQLMAHASCGDLSIDRWVEIEAKRFVQRTSDSN